MGSLLLPLTGLIWMAGPLAVTSFETRPLLIVSVALLLASTGIFVAMVWAAGTVLGFIGSLVFGLHQSDTIWDLSLEGFRVVPGAVIGTMAGLGVRRSRAADPVE